MIHRQHRSGWHRHRRPRTSWLALPLLLAACQVLALVHALSHLHVPAPDGLLSASVHTEVDHGPGSHAECRQCVEFGQIASLLPPSGSSPEVVRPDPLRVVAAVVERVALEPPRRFLARAPPQLS